MPSCLDAPSKSSNPELSQQQPSCSLYSVVLPKFPETDALAIWHVRSSSAHQLIQHITTPTHIWTCYMRIGAHGVRRRRRRERELCHHPDVAQYLDTEDTAVRLDKILTCVSSATCSGRAEPVERPWPSSLEISSPAVGRWISSCLTAGYPSHCLLEWVKLSRESSRVPTTHTTGPRGERAGPGRPSALCGVRGRDGLHQGSPASSAQLGDLYPIQYPRAGLT